MSPIDQTELCCRIVDEAPDAILYADHKGIIRLWNRGAELIFGFAREEAIGQSLDLIIPEKLRQRHWDGYYKVMETGRSRYNTDLLATPAVNKQGERLSVEFSIIMVKAEAGEVVGVAAIMRDVSAQHAEKKALREKIVALEKQHQ
jgi:PAS domain S-box-containing protein